MAAPSSPASATPLASTVAFSPRTFSARGRPKDTKLKATTVLDFKILKETTLARISSTTFLTLDEGELRVWPTNKFVKLRALRGI